MNSQARTGARKRYPALDGLRALAAALILLLHATYGQFQGGFLGVDIFFVLSGFLITSSLVSECRRHGRISLRQFWTRRAKRLLPAFALMLLLSRLIWNYIIPTPPPFARAATIAALYLANIQAVVDPTKLGPLLHTWSLSTEEQFYLFWPLVAILVLRVRRPWPIRLLLAAALVASVVRAVLFSLGLPAASCYFSPLCRVDQLLLGCSLALAVGGQMPSATLLRALSLAFLTALIVLVLRTDVGWAPYYYGGMTVFALGAACLIASLRDDTWWLSQLLSVRPLVWIGQRSYGIYLFHFPIFCSLTRFRTRHSLINFAEVTIARIAITLCVAALSWKFVEWPLMGVRQPGTSMPALKS